MLCVPGVSWKALVVNEAVAVLVELAVRVTVESRLLPSLNVTEPVGVYAVADCDDTTAVNVTVDPYTDDNDDDDNANDDDA